MSARTYVESLLKGWLPKNPLEAEKSLSVYEDGERLLNGNRRVLRFGGLSGLLWSVLSLLSAAGLAYAVGVRSPLYSVADISLILTAMLFFVGTYLVFSRINRSKVRAALSLGIMGGLVRFSMYLSTQVVLGFGVGSGLVQQLAKMGYYVSLQLLSGLLIAASIILFGTLVSQRPFRLVSIALGAIGLGGSLFGLASVSEPNILSPPQLSQAAQTLSLYIPIVWVVLMSVSFLFSGKAIGWRTSVFIFSFLLLMSYLSILGVFWLPRLV